MTHQHSASEDIVRTNLPWGFEPSLWPWLWGQIFKIVHGSSVDSNSIETNNSLSYNHWTEAHFPCPKILPVLTILSHTQTNTWLLMPLTVTESSTCRSKETERRGLPLHTWWFQPPIPCTPTLPPSTNNPETTDRHVKQLYSLWQKEGDCHSGLFTLVVSHGIRWACYSALSLHTHTQNTHTHFFEVGIHIYPSEIDR